ncbi:hypothetical protein B0H14DRAFT_2631477 [Mycena olivaceomarginata]|nr:hypothetical protein B0H14DRAFT_2631477 [Mycena olivaceomarginata]
MPTHLHQSNSAASQTVDPKSSIILRLPSFCRFSLAPILPESYADSLVEFDPNGWNFLLIPLSVNCTNFAVDKNGGLVCAGDAKKSDSKGEAPPSTPLGRGQRKKIGALCYQGPFGRSSSH